MKRNRRTAFILAAGLGTRLKELTANKPKALVSINNVPLLEVLLEELIKQDFNHIVVNVHHFGEQIIEFLEDFSTTLEMTPSPSFRLKRSGTEKSPTKGNYFV